MKQIVKILGAILLSFFVIWLQMFLSYSLPNQFSHVNFLICFLVVWLMWSGSGSVVWISFLLHLFLEFYSFDSLFGVMLFSGFFTSLVALWFYRGVLTNRSFWVVIVLSAAMVTLYRFLYMVLTVSTSFFAGRGYFDFRVFAIVYLWEVLFTASLSLIIYFVLSSISKRMNVKFIKGV